MEQQTERPHEAPASLLRNLSRSASVKILVLGGLALVMLIPVGFVLSLVREREERLISVQEEISEVWGTAQTLTGPVVVVPFRRSLPPEEMEGGAVGKPRWSHGEAVVLPTRMEVTGSLEPQVRHRGIFEATVYTAELVGKGVVDLSAVDGLGMADTDIEWEDARLVMTVSDPHGLLRPPALTWADRRVEVEPTGQEATLPGSGLSAPLPRFPSEESAGRYPFTFEMAMRGSGGLQIVPAARHLHARLNSSWADPGFDGSSLPATSSIGETGFEAEWDVSHVARPYPQQWLSDRVDRADLRAAIQESAFGVRLTLPANAYQQTERIAKYAILIIALTFGTFLLCELTAGRRLHPVQYLLVGGALALFYLLMLSLTEHLRFGLAYSVAAAATVLLIAGYARSILASKRLALALLAWLALLYGYVFVLLRLEDLALLAGSLGLFILLALFMWLTRHLNWYELSFGPSPEAG